MQWANAQAYDQFMGRWSRVAGETFLSWMRLPSGLHWLDVGCGTGTFSQVILESSQPKKLVCIDPSEELLAEARTRLGIGQVTILPGNALDLPFGEPAFDVAVSALVLNFVPDPVRMTREMKRVVRNGGWVASYVWDFHGGGSVTQHIGRALAELDPRHAEAASAAQRAETTSLVALTRIFDEVGFGSIRTASADVEIRFDDFEDYWLANNAFVSPHVRQLSALVPEDRTKVKERVRTSLTPSDKGTIEYIARVNCVQGLVST